MVLPPFFREVEFKVTRAASLWVPDRCPHNIDGKDATPCKIRLGGVVRRFVYDIPLPFMISYPRFRCTVLHARIRAARMRKAGTMPAAAENRRPAAAAAAAAPAAGAGAAATSGPVVSWEHEQEAASSSAQQFTYFTPYVSEMMKVSSASSNLFLSHILSCCLLGGFLHLP